MSKLSALLNPAPSLHISHSSAAEPVQERHDNSHYLANSPLTTLAIAATSSTADQSPVQPYSAPFTPSNGYHQTHSSPSSRPGSSHFQLPAPHNLSLTSGPPQHPFSPTFEHHHQSLQQKGVRRSSDFTSEAFRELPPLRKFSNEEMENATTIGRNGGLFIDLGHGGEIGQLPGIKDIENTDRFLENMLDQAENHLNLQNQVDVGSAIDTHEPEETRPVDVKAEGTDDTRASPLHTQPKIPYTTSLDGANATSEEMAPKLEQEDNHISPPLTTENNVPHPTTPFMVQPPRPRKRPAPKTDRKVEKKGTASAIKKPAVKKRKLDVESAEGTPFSQRSGTPLSSRASKTPAPRNRKQNSATPMRSSPAAPTKDAANGLDEDLDEDSEVFCICRKPDDHTWMIACDGGCDDWFHGRCVDVDQQDEGLIDKFICPGCRDKGVGVTTWKPMCRLDGCRKPARANSPKPSKYCSDDHGEQFMRQFALGKDAKKETKSKASAARKRRKDNHTDNAGNVDDVPSSLVAPEDDDNQSHLRGGILRPKELKSLSTDVKDLCDFRKLGEGVLSPPQTASPDGRDTKMGAAELMESEKEKVAYTAEEQVQLTQIGEKRDFLRRRKAALDDKDKFLAMIKARAKSILEDLKKREGVKDACGYDPRLSWSDEEFDVWRTSPDGQARLKSGLLDAPSSSSPLTTITSAPSDSLSTVSSYPALANGLKSSAESADVKSTCTKKRCERHKQWYKLQQQEIAFEKDDCRQEMRRLEAEEKGVGERAMVRSLEGGEEEVLGGSKGVGGEEVKVEMANGEETVGDGEMEAVPIVEGDDMEE